MGQGSGESRPESLASLFSGVLDNAQRAKMSANQRAALLWNTVNGDVEREHTTGVFVIEPQGRATLPTLGVYVDSRMRQVDFTAKRETYLARLHMAGQDFRDVKFMVSKGEYVARKKAAADRRASAKPKPVDVLPDLTAEEEAKVRAAVAALPEGIRDKVYEAMSLSMRREKTQTTKGE